MQCSEWEDHYGSTTTSSDDDEDADGNRDSRSDIRSRSNFGSSVWNEEQAAAAVPKKTPPMTKSQKGDDDAGSSVSWNAAAGNREISDARIVVSHKDLKEIFDAIKEYFDKAATEGEKLSEMLEVGRAQLDRSFSQLKSKFKFKFR